MTKHPFKSWGLGLKKIQSIVAGNLEHRTTGNSDKLRLKSCVLCGNQKYSVSLNARSGYISSYCCDRSTHFVEWMMHVWGVSTMSAALRLMDATPYLSVRDEARTAFLESFAFGSDGSEILPEFTEKHGWNEILSSAPPGSESYRAWQYADSRKIPMRNFAYGTIGTFKSGPLAGRLSFLCRDPKTWEPTGAVGRAIAPWQEPKYLMLRINEKVAAADQDKIIFMPTPPGAFSGDSLTIVEGAISACFIKNSVATLGKSISFAKAKATAQAADLGGSRELCYWVESGVAWDTIEKNVASIKGATSLPLRLCFEQTGDPAECSRDELTEVLRSGIVIDCPLDLSALRLRMGNNMTACGLDFLSATQ